MKKLVGFSLALVSAISIAIPSSTSAASHYSTFGGELIDGVGNWGSSVQHYWIDSSASGESSRINSSMSAWVNTSHIRSTPIYFRSTTNRPSSVIDIYKGDYYPKSFSVLGETKFYNSGGSEINPSNNYSWTKIQLNAPNFDSLSSFDKSGTIAHEMGHAFGLAHNQYEKDSIMCQLGKGRYVNTPDIGSLYGINALYTL
jgi:hypothetical protein